ncbi:N-acyl homoserine lactonase family protein [Brevibacterium aurantiacum]|uniref:Metallo-beta-lactamase domain-containing protein n=1 Tax=Brevibacterium aurantiacum TaxID=273384 RepID=A0A2A3ZTV6_BREAU|nr:N-acyl homoserine lactonase family protein [Brevibacterium aurantiacum]PCC55110.1 hypothetical protein CIK59_02810 [Brevibacterium aurantiacum]
MSVEGSGTRHAATDEGRRMTESNANSVVAIRYGEWTSNRSDILLDPHSGAGKEPEATLAYYFWIVQAGQRLILIDTGFSAEVGRRRGRTVLIDPIDAFRALGLNPECEIDIVLTHAHYDHIGNAEWFKNANFHMSQAEYDFWTGEVADAPSFAPLVETDELEHLRRLADSGRLALFDGDLRLAPGVELLLGPGHTPGELMARVDTPDGVVLLTSDAVHLDEELRTEVPFRHMSDLITSHMTYRRITSFVDTGEVDHVIAGHEPTVADRYPSLSSPLEKSAVLIAGVWPQL